MGMELTGTKKKALNALADFKEPERDRPLSCPVCLGVEMAKRSMTWRHKLVLDQCERCGGLWFDQGEVLKLRKLKPKARWRKAVQSTGAYTMPCHSCGVMMDRNAPEILGAAVETTGELAGDALELIADIFGSL